jgi:hypothetical protein
MPAFGDVPTLAVAVPGLYSDTWMTIAEATKMPGDASSIV